MKVEEQESVALLPASPLRRRVFLTCMAVVVMQLVWAMQRHS